MTKEESLKAIVDEVLALESPKIHKSREGQIFEFINTTVNGDKLIAHLVVNVGLGGGREGAVCYILTNKRLIKVDIDAVNIEAKNFWLNTIVNSERKLIEGDKEQFDIIFQNGSFGLKYPSENKTITAFFQAIEQQRGDL